jgi:putative holliday junction resolvase
VTGRALGVDLGARRIGLAISDSNGVVASPLRVIQRTGDPDADHRAIAAIAVEEDADVVVVGFPRSLSGDEGPAARAVLDEVDDLRAVCGPSVAVEVADERLTTVVAQQALTAGGVPARKQRAVVDKVAAAVMLQGWLDAGGGRP